MNRRAFVSTLGLIVPGCMGMRTDSETDNEDDTIEEIADVQQDFVVSDDEPTPEVSVRMRHSPDIIFDPQVAWVEPGGTVTWTNVDGHDGHDTVAYSDRIPDGAEPWHSEVLGEYERFTHQFDQEGVYDYYCTPHASWMVGSVIVGTPAPTDQPALEEPDDNIGAGAQIRALNELVTTLLEEEAN